MAIPDYQTFMKPLLQFLSDGRVYSLSQCMNHMVNLFKISEKEQHELLPSGKQSIVSNRIGWARTYLKKAGLIEVPKRGCSNITEKGLELLKQNPDKITNKTLKQYPEFLEFFDKVRNSKKDQPTEEDKEKTPEEELEESFENLKKELEEELLSKVKSCTPQFFERMVIDLLLGMGYGGSRHEAGKAIGGVGDEGIDGIISEDRLGLDKIYIQAKRWEGCVSRPEVQKFAGALQGKRASKGIFITTSYYSSEARNYVKQIGNQIILIDGQQLVRLMTEFNIGVEPKQVYELKRLDNDYFEEG